MLIEETIQKLIAMKMPTMAQAARELLQSAPSNQLSFEDKLGLVVDREWTERDNRRVTRRIKEARLGTSASLEAIDCDPARGLDKAMVRQAHDVPVGQTKAEHHHHRSDRHRKEFLRLGTGRGCMQAGCARSSCVSLASSRSSRSLASSGAYASTLAKISRVEVVVLDDFLLTPMQDAERRDLLELLEDRYGRASTIITSQMPTKTWHDALNDPTIADAICDRVLHNAHIVELHGQSMRKKNGLKTQKH